MNLRQLLKEETAKLLRCPFCGCAPRISGDSCSTFWIECTGCTTQRGHSASSLTGEDVGEFPSPESARNAWNKQECDKRARINEKFVGEAVDALMWMHQDTALGLHAGDRFHIEGVARLRAQWIALREGNP